MRRPVCAAALAAALVSVNPLPAAAQDAAAGRRLANASQACHGLDGLSKLPEAPHIAGQPAIYLERSLRAYKSGERRNEVMSVVAKMLSDDDIRNLAAYFSSIQIEAKVPQ
jgi:cytochrome c553